MKHFAIRSAAVLSATILASGTWAGGTVGGVAAAAADVPRGSTSVGAVAHPERLESHPPRIGTSHSAANFAVSAPRPGAHRIGKLTRDRLVVHVDLDTYPTKKDFRRSMKANEEIWGFTVHSIRERNPGEYRIKVRSMVFSDSGQLREVSLESLQNHPGVLSVSPKRSRVAGPSR